MTVLTDDSQALEAAYNETYEVELWLAEELGRDPDNHEADPFDDLVEMLRKATGN